MKKKNMLPLKMSVIKWLQGNPDASIHDIMDGLREEYGTEGQFNIGNFQHMMAAMRAVGIVENTKVEMGEKEEIVLRYSLTKSGIHSMKYIPN